MKNKICAICCILALLSSMMILPVSAVTLNPSADASLMSDDTTAGISSSVEPTGSSRYVDVPHLVAGTATTYTDTRGHWAEEEIAEATKNGLMNGMGDGTFAPDEKVTLGQAITIYLRTCRFSETKIDASYSEPFADVTDWLVPPIAVFAYLDPAYANAKRYDSYGRRIYGVNRPASREDVAGMFGAGYAIWLDSNPEQHLSSSLNDISKLDADSWSRIAYLDVRGVIKGYPDGSFRPNANIKRGEIAKIANRAFAAGISDYYILPEIEE